MKRSSKLVMAVGAAALFLALGSGIAFAYASGYRSNAPVALPANAAPGGSVVTAGSAAFTPGVSPVVQAQTQATSGPPTTAQVVPPQPGPGWCWDAVNWRWTAPTTTPSSASTPTPTTERPIPVQPGPGWCWDAANWRWNAPETSTPVAPRSSWGGPMGGRGGCW